MATQMTELVKTEFDKLDVYKRREPISKDDAQGLFGEDVVLKKMNDQTSQNTKGVFAERFEEAEIPKETVETKIRTGFKSTFHNKTVSFLTVGKRADEAKKKITLQKHINKELLNYSTRRSDVREAERKSLLADDVRKLSGRFKTKEEKEALQEWVVSPEHGLGKTVKMTTRGSGLGDTDDNKFGNACGSVIEEAAAGMNLEDFSFNSDAKFASGFAKKYDTLCRTAAADVMLQKFDGLIAAGDFLASERYKNTAEARAKIAMAKEMKTYYEKRMKMMQSPYYVLLGAKDLKAYMGDDWEEKLQREVKDEGFKEYVRLYREVKESAYGKKGNLQAIYDRLVSDIRITLKDRDLESFNKIYGDPERYKDKDPETIFRNVRDSLAQEKKDEYPPDNIEFLEKIEPVQGGTIRPGALDIEDIRSMEKILLEIKKNKTVEGTALKPEEVGEYGKEIDRIIGLRRNYISMRPGVEKVLEIREGGNIEAKNPEFAKTEQGRIVQMMTNEDSYDIAETLLSEVNRQGVEYVNALQSIMNNLMDSGYSISRKYEQRLTDSEDKTVEEIRKAYQDKINKKNKASADTRVEFPVFTINGTTFCTYGLEGMLDLLAGKDLKIEGENGEKAVELMGKYTELSKKSVVLFDLYGSESGMKHILFNYYKKKYTEELTGTRRELIPLLEGSVEGIEGYK